MNPPPPPPQKKKKKKTKQNQKKKKNQKKNPNKQTNKQTKQNKAHTCVSCQLTNPNFVPTLNVLGTSSRQLFKYPIFALNGCGKPAGNAYLSRHQVPSSF